MFQRWVVEMIVAEKCEGTQYLLAVCSKMVITTHVVPAYSPITRIPAKWKMSLES